MARLWRNRYNGTQRNEPMLFMEHCIIQAFRGNGNKVTITNAATEFHVYKTESTNIQIFVDDKLIHSKANDNTIPFNKDFFLDI
jgi:hypothetical protein